MALRAHINTSQASYPVEILSRMLSRMPKLHSFLLSDAPLKREHHAYNFNLARAQTRQREVVHEWAKFAGSLRRIAFTTEMEWVRCGREWVPVYD